MTPPSPRPQHPPPSEPATGLILSARGLRKDYGKSAEVLRSD